MYCHFKFGSSGEVTVLRHPDGEIAIVQKGSDGEIIDAVKLPDNQAKLVADSILLFIKNKRPV